MMKKITFFFIFGFLCFSGFCHKAQKQTETFYLEPLTEKWIEFEYSAGDDIQNNFEAFLAEVKKAEPSETVIYYFPDQRSFMIILLTASPLATSRKLQKTFRVGKFCRKIL